jgi:uncharacterized lipoprotein YddW (UPF0748 family)
MRKLLVLFSILSCSIFVSAQVVNQPKCEFRGAWIHTVGNMTLRTMTQEQIRDMYIGTLDSLQAAGCNAVIFQVRPQADAFYISDLEPWSRYLTGIQGVAPNPLWDPLEFMIEQSHKRGMELHAWCNPYRVTSLATDDLAPSHIYFKHPEIFKKYGEQLYFDPGEPLSIKHTKEVIADIVTRYDVDAIHFDDYFYPYPVRFEEFHDDYSFVKYGLDKGFSYWEKNQWRRNNVTTLVRELNDTIKSIKPWVRFGISPFGIHRNIRDTPDGTGSQTNGLSNYDQLFADVPRWAAEGDIDYIVPQLYWIIGHPSADYCTLINWWNKGCFTPHLYIGQSISVMKDQMNSKMELVRTLPNVEGNVWWPGVVIPKNAGQIFDSLAYKYQTHPSLIPPYTELDSIAPLPVAKIKKFKNEVKWECIPTDDVFQQPHFYAIYLFPKGISPDISISDYLISITDSPFYVFPSKFKFEKGDQLVVTVIDRCWNESESSAPFVMK